MPSFSVKSASKLDTCVLPLQELFNEVVKAWDCTVLEGNRGEAAQDKAFLEGRSKVKFPDSNHNTNPSKAVDIVPYPIDWENLQRFKDFANFVKGVAHGRGISVRWGGDFKNFFDGPHWEVL